MPYEQLLPAFDAETDSMKLEERPLSDRPYLWFAELNARVGRVDKARALIAKYDAATARDTALRRWNTPDYQRAMSQVLAAEKKWLEAAKLLRMSDRRPDGPANDCADCGAKQLLDLFVRAGMADSALSAYQAYRQTVQGGRPLTGPDYALGAPLTEAVARVYDSKGDVKNAAKLYGDFIEMWKNADPELQPRVKAARERLAQLTPVEKVRR